MTTHTITGLAVGYNNSGTAISLNSAVFTGVTSDIFTLSYSNPVFYPGDTFPTVDLEPASGTEFLLEVAYNGIVVNLSNPATDLDALVGYVLVGGQVITVLSFYDPIANVDMTFQLSGPPLMITTLAEWNALEASITFAGAVTSGPFAANTAFGLEDFVAHSSVEHDTITGGATADIIDAGVGNDIVSGLDGNDRLTGGTGHDRLNGGNDDDRLYGDSGNDRLYGGSGNDRVWGGNGRDVVNLGSGDDEFFDTSQSGANGADQINGGSGNDIVRGGGGNELIHGDNGNDRLFGGDDNDRIYGDNGNDRIFGDDGNDRLYGGGGGDRMFGGDGDDRMFGNIGNDLMYGQAGADRLYGSAGNDRLEGGSGNDLLSGGADADVFVFRAAFDTDVVTDYVTGEDTMRLDDAIWGGGLTAAQVVSTYASVVGSDVVIDFGGGNTITLEGVNTLVGLEADILII